MVLDEPDVVGFLDAVPVFHGHVLLVPREHVETLPDLPAAHLAPLFGTAQRLCRAVERAQDAQGTFVAVNNRISQSVPHLHVHVVPRRTGDGLVRPWTALGAGNGELAAVAGQLRGEDDPWYPEVTRPSGAGLPPGPTGAEHGRGGSRGSAWS